MQPVTGIVRKQSHHSVPNTVARIEAILRTRGLQIFARFDHSGEAAKVGLLMPPTQVVVFGSPRAGTPIMLAAPLAAIELPLRVLVSEEEGVTFVSFLDADDFARRFDLRADQVKPVASVTELVEAALK